MTAASAVLVAAAVVGVTVGKPDAKAARAQPECTNVSLGFLGPLTGRAAFIGKEQLSWLRFAVQKYNAANDTSFDVELGNTRLKAGVARSAARRFIGNRSILAVIGGSENQAVRVSGNLFEKANLASVAGSPTAVDLTKGHRYRTFFRVVPNDSTQAPAIVRYVAGPLRARHVVVVDSRDDYSIPLTSTIARGLRIRNVNVMRDSVSPSDTDFSELVARVGGNVKVVVFATQVPDAANTLANQLREQGRRAVVFGTDGAYSPDEFKPRSGFVSAFAPDLRTLGWARPIVREYNRYSRNRPFGIFGPPTYMAGWVAMDAVRKACSDGNATRAEVTDLVRVTNVSSIIGGRTRFDKKGDLRGDATFTVFKITNGRYAVA